MTVLYTNDQAIAGQLEAAVAKLAALGNTADEVAGALIRLGIRAYCGDAAHCVIAEFMNREIPAASATRDVIEFEVDASTGGPWTVEVENRSWGRWAKVELPGHLGDLAARFDRGEWPELVSP